MKNFYVLGLGVLLLLLTACAAPTTEEDVLRVSEGDILIEPEDLSILCDEFEVNPTGFTKEINGYTFVISDTVQQSDATTGYISTADLQELCAASPQLAPSVDGEVSFRRAGGVVVSAAAGEAECSCDNCCGYPKKGCCG